MRKRITAEERDLIEDDLRTLAKRHRLTFISMLQMASSIYYHERKRRSEDNAHHER